MSELLFVGQSGKLTNSKVKNIIKDGIAFFE